MEAYTYLLINFFTIIICFIFSFHPKIKFNRYFWAFLKASSLVAVFFVAWDIWFTAHGVWWFNDRYLLGFRIGGLPIEEILFFICIPFSCVFTYHCLTRFYDLEWSRRASSLFSITFVLLCVVLAIISWGKIYPFVTFVLTAATLVYLMAVAKIRWLGRASTLYGVLLIGFFLVNGVLTGTGLEEAVVNYNPDHFWGIRILTVPVEDAVYGYSLFLWNIYFFTLFKKHEEVPQQALETR
ncbi:lycopene cyclase domain-containing protein [Sphingobacterium bambusae]|uniref:Lycopene cyclase domain-containing protein n=1 Tax=Sphingobacterium bambusae TaxID=662858 RepID=A0ABW6BPB6_9SPHI|nr:lycopene cyclase domain-containing protein [Sphingobacterium bambusae]WPL48086.1 lycopene cyclase domain-containing protein [Sphingobacterium bambusae]